MNGKLSLFSKSQRILALILMMASLFPLMATKSSASIDAGEQKKAEKGLRDNKYFVYYINASISNTGNEEEKAQYTKAVKHNIVAKFYYLRLSFHKSYVQIREAQRILIELYQSNMKNELSSSDSFCNSIAPKVIYSEDYLARHYLYLAYRNLKSARQYMVMADHYKRTLYSLRLYKYIKGMKKLKEGKRYAVSAMLQTRVDDKMLFVKHDYSYEELIELIKQETTDDETEKVLRFFMDSYYRVEGETLYDKVWNNPEIESFKPFKKYLETTE